MCIVTSALEDWQKRRGWVRQTDDEPEPESESEREFLSCYRDSHSFPCLLPSANFDKIFFSNGKHFGLQ
jgi:hypothetical protein